MDWDEWTSGPTLVGLVLAAAALVLAVWQTLRAEKLARRVKNVSWADIEDGSTAIRKRIASRGRPIGLVMAPGTRGGVVANLVARGLPERPAVLIGVTARQGQSSPLARRGVLISRGSKWEVYLPMPVAPADVTGDVLIIDDFARTGDFMVNARAHFTAAGFAPDRLVTAALVVSSIADEAGNLPDMFWRRVPGIEFSFPWGQAE